MSLTEGELIEEIEELDEGWWSGVGQGGAKRGLFPGASRYTCDQEPSLMDVASQLR